MFSLSVLNAVYWSMRLTCLVISYFILSSLILICHTMHVCVVMWFDMCGVVQSLRCVIHFGAIWFGMMRTARYSPRTPHYNTTNQCFRDLLVINFNVLTWFFFFCLFSLFMFRTLSSSTFWFFLPSTGNSRRNMLAKGRNRFKWWWRIAI